MKSIESMNLIELSQNELITISGGDVMPWDHMGFWVAVGCGGLLGGGTWTAIYYLSMYN
jgi:hypothetical protein